ncbi:MAG: WD40 repeat domain-containing serine/threonine-protein kinase [Planctomycetota bacterium]
MTSGDGTHVEPSDELELAEIVEAFQEARRAVGPPSVEDWVARNPRFADALRALLPGVVLIESVAGYATSSIESAARDEPLPTSIGEYEIEGRLGRGGMGVVYLARQGSLGRLVALKVLPTNVDQDSAFLERFRREARVAARLTHPHIVPVYGVGRAEGRSYYAMRYVDGRSLDDVLRAMRDLAGDAPSSGAGRERREASGRPSEVGRIVETLRARERGDEARTVPSRVSVRSSVRLALQVAEALEHAHVSGVLHRDIKPGNILLDAEGHAWVTDFGLCRIEEAGSLTSDGAVVGTLRYMAPEQVEGAAEERSDVYALGLVLFEVLTGRPAFDTTHRARLIHDVLHVSPPRVRRLRPDVPRDVETIVQKATAKLPEERYPSAAAFARDLRAFLEDRPIQARPPRALYLARLFLSRHRVASAVTAVAALMFAGLGALYVRDLRASGLESERRAYVGGIIAAEAALREGSIDRAKERLADAPERWRAWEWDYLAARVDQAIRSDRLGSRGFVQLAVHPSGELVAASSAQGISLVRIADATIVDELIEPKGRFVAWDRRGDHLAGVFDDSHVVVFGRGDDGAFREVERYEDLGRPMAAAFVDELLVIGGDGGEIWVIDRERAVRRRAGTLVGATRTIGVLDSVGDERPGRWWAVTNRGSLALGRRSIESRIDLDLAGEDLRDAALAPDGMDGVCVTNGGAVLSFTFDGPGTRRVHGVDGGLNSVAYDGREAVVVGRDRLVHVVDVRSRRSIRALSGTPVGLRDVAFVPSGDAILSVDGDGVLRRWPRRVAGGGVGLHGHVHDVNGIAFDAEGSRLATGGRDGQVIVWDTRTCTPIHRFTGPAGPVGTVAFVDDDTKLVGAASMGALHLWSLASDRLLRLVELEGGLVHDVAAHPDRDAVYVACEDGLRVFSRSLDGLGDWIQGEGVSNIELDVRRDRILGVLSDGSVFAIDCATGRVVYRVDHERPPVGLGMALAPEAGPAAGLAAYATVGWGAVLYRADDGRIVGEIEDRGPDGGIGERLMGVNFSPDGERVLATTTSGLLSVFSVDGFEHLIDLRGHEIWAMRVKRCDATGHLATVSSDETVRIWNTMTTADWIAERELSSAPIGGRDLVAELERPAILESIWDELRASAEPVSPASWTLLTLMDSRDPGDPLTSALHALAAVRTRTRDSDAAQLRFAAGRLPADDPRQAELRRAIRAFERGRLLADISGFALGVEESIVLPRKSVQRTLLACVSYFPWTGTASLAVAAAPWIDAWRLLSARSRAR